MVKNNIILILFAVLVLSVSSCSKKKAGEDGAENTGPITNSEIAGDLADSDSGRAMGLQTVYYGYDSSNLDSKSKAALTENSRILKDKSSLKVQIEGHTDERGGIQYNVALGERRANSAKAFLVDQGIAADRVSIISYGKEKPMDPGHTEDAWSKNRRANFRVTEK